LPILKKKLPSQRSVIQANVFFFKKSSFFRGMFRPFLVLMYIVLNPKKFRKMKRVNLNEQWNSQSSFDSFAVFTISGKKMNFVRGGGDPIPPGTPPGGIPGWQDDDEQP